MNDTQATPKHIQRSTDLLKEITKEPYAWPGGHRKWALMNDGLMLSFEACKQESELILNTDGYDGWTISELFVHWQGEPLECDHTGEYHHSEYGPDDEE